MKIISESAEHHFLTMVEGLKEDPKGWVALNFSLGNALSFETMSANLPGIPAAVSALRQRSTNFSRVLAAKLAPLGRGYIYLFADGDVVAMVLAGKAGDRERLETVFKDLAAAARPAASDMTNVFGDIYVLSKLADRKILSARLFEAYAVMADANKTASIPVRRMRHENWKVLLAEDDRFTATYTAGILGKEYDLIVCPSGEEAVIAYIEHAPHLALADVHLPGISGHQTLQAINAVDSGAFVVMLSVDTVKDNIVKASESGAKNFLKKPFTKDRLLHVVKNSPYIRGYTVDPGGA